VWSLLRAKPAYKLEQQQQLRKEYPDVAIDDFLRGIGVPEAVQRDALTK